MKRNQKYFIEIDKEILKKEIKLELTYKYHPQIGILSTYVLDKLEHILNIHINQFDISTSINLIFNKLDKTNSRAKLLNIIHLLYIDSKYFNQEHYYDLFKTELSKLNYSHYYGNKKMFIDWMNDGTLPIVKDVSKAVNFEKIKLTSKEFIVKDILNKSTRNFEIGTTFVIQHIINNTNAEYSSQYSFINTNSGEILKTVYEGELHNYFRTMLIEEA